jgi:hypothetical protein
MFSLLCNFLHRTAIKEFPPKYSVQTKRLLLTKKCINCTPAKARIKRLYDLPIFKLILLIASIFRSFCLLRQSIQCLANYKYKLTLNSPLRLLAWLKLQKKTIKKLKRRNKPL